MCYRKRVMNQGIKSWQLQLSRNVRVILAYATFPSNPLSSKMVKVIAAQLVLTVTKMGRFVDVLVVPVVLLRIEVRSQLVGIETRLLEEVGFLVATIPKLSILNS